jgi:hypothetical protein
MNAALPTLRLYQIADDYRLALDALAEQADRDEPLPEALFATLDALAGSFTDKAVNVAAYLRALDAEAAAIADVKKAMERRQTALEHQAERLRRYLKGEMERTGLTRVQHPWLTVRVQANPPSVVIDDAARLPDGFKQAVTTVKLLKADLAQALKAGQSVAGAHLEQTTRLVIA